MTARNLTFPYVFLVCFSSLYGGHICKNHRTFFYEELELVRLLNGEPYLLKLGRDRLSQRDPAFALRFLPRLDVSCSP